MGTVALSRDPRHAVVTRTAGRDHGDHQLGLPGPNTAVIGRPSMLFPALIDGPE